MKRKYKIDIYNAKRTSLETTVYADCVRVSPNQDYSFLVLTTVKDRTATEYSKVDIDVISFGTTGEGIMLLFQTIPAPSGTGEGPSIRPIMITQGEYDDV